MNQDVPCSPHSMSPPSSLQQSLVCQHHVGPLLDQQHYLNRTLDGLHQVKAVEFAEVPDVQNAHCSCDLCECTVVFPAATAEASVSGLKRPPTVEGAPSTKRRGVEEGTSPEGNIQWVGMGWNYTCTVHWIRRLMFFGCGTSRGTNLRIWSYLFTATSIGKGKRTVIQ